MRDPRDVESHGCGTPGTRDRGAEDPGTRGPRPGRRVPPVGAVSGRPAPWPVPPPAARPPRPGQRRRAALPRARGRHGPAAAARRCLPRLHPRHVRDRPVGPAPDGHNTERGEHPVPALPHHRREQPELAGLRLPEAGLDADRGEHHRRRAADPLHPGVLLLQPRQGQDPPDQVDALPVLPADGHHLPGLRQLDAVRRAAPRPVHHGPQRAGDRHQRPAVLAVLAVPAGPGQALPPSARVSETTGGPAGAPGQWALPPTKARGRAARGLGPSGRSSPTAQGLGAAGLLPALPPCAHRPPRAPGPSTLLPAAGVHPQRGVWGAGASCPSFVWI
ncbi:sugar transporter SWEET1 isoform X1 [Dromaius novaehollandiae]|uniref:sugar transporter SWEET1 isoform X1 n=1 Tax=Dromaius novaehollandiae TaxID=8790 RepID=UPI00311F54FB